MREISAQSFPYGSVVTYCGTEGAKWYIWGIVVRGDGVPADKLALLFENGNTWWKEIERCERVPSWKAPQWVRRWVLARKGIKLMPCVWRRHALP